MVVGLEGGEDREAKGRKGKVSHSYKMLEVHPVFNGFRRETDTE